MSLVSSGSTGHWVDLGPSGSLNVFASFTEKTEPEPQTTETGKTFTRKLPIRKALNELGQVAIEIEPTEDGTYMTRLLTDLVECDDLLDPLEKKTQKFF